MEVIAAALISPWSIWRSPPLCSKQDSALVAQGLLLQTRANDLSRARRYTDALPLLDLACDALGRVSSDLLRTAADNYALALLDRCWCVFSCRLVARYPTATQDLALCLSLLQQMHGPNMERLTRLSHGLRPEHAVYAKLHLLRGVTDYELGRHDAAHAAFALARAHAAKLAVDEGAVTALIAAAGGRLPVATARMALRCSEGRVDDALAYVTELRVRAGEERARRRRRAQDREDQAYLGRTASGRHVDMDAVAQLTSAAGGRVDRRVVGAVLRSCDNNVTYASEILFNEVKLGAFLLGQVVQRWYGGYYVEEAQRRRRKAAKKKRKELEAEAAEGAGPSSRSGAGPSRGAAAAPVLASGCAPREVDRAARAVGDPEQLQAAGPDPDPDVEGGSEEEEEEGKQEAEEAALLASLQRQGRDGFASYDDEGCGEVIARVLAEYEARMAGTT